ncbi:endonuclease [Staphylococcus equorum]|uniref:DNA/RNA non-specific endonuclease n=1 Tax=Staphylococcus equorum TaxID=246432 RepID=UPI000D1C6E29|nr:DNA/RNA non-specific endonuclease [Staphylococcus equorum]PTE82292.1 endonuclease [Staphylococcus equorum]
MKKILSSIATVVVLFIAGIFYIQDETDFDIEGMINNVTTGSIENTKEDKELIGEETNSENYKFINDNTTSLSSDDKTLLDKKGDDKFWVNYSSLDKYGRGGKVEALVTHKSVSDNATKNKKRPSFASNLHIAGEYKDGYYDATNQTWKSYELENAKQEHREPIESKYKNNKILQLDGYRGYLYNKSHSLAWSLGGDMEAHNLTLGTRSQNVGSNSASDGGGMGYPETQIRNAIYDNQDAKVYYQVVPVYKDKELLPRGSHVRAYSVNDNGKTVNLNVWISNTQKGLNINYQDGTYTQSN